MAITIEKLADLRAAMTQGDWAYRKYFQEDDMIEMARALGIEPTMHLDNNGSAFVTHEGGNVCKVTMHAAAKRGMAYKTECAERDANAEAIALLPQIIDLLIEKMK